MAIDLRTPPASPPIQEIHVWIGHYGGGGEGILSHDMELEPGLTRHMPLMSSSLDVARRAGPLAESVRLLSLDSARPVTRVELCSFRAVAENAP